MSALRYTSASVCRLTLLSVKCSWYKHVVTRLTQSKSSPSLMLNIFLSITICAVCGGLDWGRCVDLMCDVMFDVMFWCLMCLMLCFLTCQLDIASTWVAYPFLASHVGPELRVVSLQQLQGCSAKEISHLKVSFHRSGKLFPCQTSKSEIHHKMYPTRQSRTQILVSTKVCLIKRKAFHRSLCF